MVKKVFCCNCIYHKCDFACKPVNQYIEPKRVKCDGECTLQECKRNCYDDRHCDLYKEDIELQKLFSEMVNY